MKWVAWFGVKIFKGCLSEIFMKTKKSWYKRWWAITIFIIIGLGIVGAIFGEDTDSELGLTGEVISNKPEIIKYQCADNTFVSNSEDCPKLETTPTQISTPAVEEESDTATMGEKNALSKALSYLKYAAFSYSGLINQLEFEGFTYEEAKYGVDNCGADWNEQAALKAESYLDFSAFSREGLIDQLEYEGFTREQAEYGVQAVGY